MRPLDPSAVRPKIAIDLGNSAAKWAVDDQPENRVSLRSSGWTDCLINDVNAATGGQQPVWKIASVNRPITKLLVARLQEADLQADVQIITPSDIPLIARVENPDRVGIDRLLAAWMASRVFPGEDVIIVDAGSAITVDIVNQAGEFLGGVILPGIALQFDSLARGTDALPAIDLPLETQVTAYSLPFPATDTVSAIRSGILLGIASAVDGLIEHYLKRQDKTVVQVVFTGGDSLLLSRLSSHPHRLLPRLVLSAIGLLPETL